MVCKKMAWSMFMTKMQWAFVLMHALWSTISLEKIKITSLFSHTTVLPIIIQFSVISVAPMVWVETQLELAPVGYNISLSCKTEAFPPAIHYWIDQNGSAISTG